MTAALYTLVSIRVALQEWTPTLRLRKDKFAAPSYSLPYPGSRLAGHVQDNLPEGAPVQLVKGSG
jgi:hypothetical protein